MKNRMISVSLAMVLALSVGLIGCAGEEVPKYTLTISSTEGGSVMIPGEGTFTYNEGEKVFLAAIPDEGYRFVNWTGDVSTIDDVNAASTRITVKADYGIAANFEEIPKYNLAISSGVGGMVTSPGEGIFTYSEGVVVNLVAESDEGYRFLKWTGNVDNIANVNRSSTTITVNGDYAIMANFAQEEAVYFADANLEAAVRQAIGKPTGLIYPSNLEGLTTLHAERRNIADLTGLDSCTNLKFAYLGENRIGDLSPLATLASLVNLQLWSNEISDISPLANLTNLTELGLGINRIRDISPLRNLTRLTFVGLPLNQISDISPLANLKNLTRLGLSGHQISEIALVVDLTRLTWLRLWNSQISDISPLANLTQLRFLDLVGNPIVDISPLANLTNLTGLGLSGHQIGDISHLVDLTRLTYLSLPNSRITDISALSGLTALTYLELPGNQISDISALVNLTNLRDLNLDNNQISDISHLHNLTGLTHLRLDNNRISDISHLVNNPGLSHGDVVYLRNNPLSSTSLNTYIPQLQARGVTIYH